MLSRPHATIPEQRSALRIPAARVPSIEGVRISGSDALSTLVNISTSGVLVECSSKPRPGSTVTIHFVGTFSPATIRGRVARTIVASLGKDGVLRYLVGIAFEQEISLDEGVLPATAPATAPAPPAVASGAIRDFSEPAAKVVSRLQNRW